METGNFLLPQNCLKIGKMTDIDVFDYETWPVLSDMRKDLRERIFDEEDPQKVFSLQIQLDDVESMIKEGLSRYVPF